MEIKISSWIDACVSMFVWFDTLIHLKNISQSPCQEKNLLYLGANLSPT